MQLFILMLVFLSVKCEDQVKNVTKQLIATECTTLTDNDNTIVKDIKTVCGKKPCFTKCCELDAVLYLNKTQNHYHCLSVDVLQKILNITGHILDFSDFKVWNKDLFSKGAIQTNKILMKDFNFVVNKQLVNSSCGYAPHQKSYGFFLMEDGKFAMLHPNYYDLWLEKNASEYCLDKMFFKTKANVTKSMYFHVMLKKPGKTYSDRGVFTAVAMVISAFFLFLVLLVYSVLKQLRNIQGMILMGYITTLACGYLFKAVLLLGVLRGTIKSTQCEKLSPICYSLLLSSFFWLNIMSFDIWWTFRATRKVRSIHRQGEKMKFMWYGVYAWGVPILLGIAAYCVDAVFDMSSVPYFITPHFRTCFKDYMETILYLFTPILIMTLINTVLFIMTIYNIWLINAAMSTFENPNQTSNRNRFCLYIKLSALMGVSWILDLFDLLADKSQTWLYFLLNTYNSLIGVVIFFMFVFKFSIFKKLCERFKINNRFTRNFKVNSTRSTECSRSGKSSTKTKNFELDDVSKS